MRDLFKVALVGVWSRFTMNKTLRLVGLKPNRDLPYLNERFEAGQLVPVIDGPYKLSDARDAFVTLVQGMTRARSSSRSTNGRYGIDCDSPEACARRRGRLVGGVESRSDHPPLSRAHGTPYPRDQE